MILRYQGTLFERLVDNISHEDRRAVCSRRRQFQQQAGPGLPVSFAGMPETVVTYLMEAFRQHMKKETPQKLNALYPYGPPLARVMVFVLECDVGLVHGHQPAIRQRHAKDVTGQVVQDRLLAFSIGFAVRTPWLIPDLIGDLLEEFGMILLQRRSKPFGNHP